MASTSQLRRRNVAILTQSGFQKLQTAKSQSAIWNQYTKTCTLETLSEQTGLSTHTLSKVHARKAGVDLRTLVRYYSAFDLTLETSDYTSLDKQKAAVVETSSVSSSSEQLTPSLPASNSQVSWGTAPDVSRFCGRKTELGTLKHWILEQRCRLITLSGMGGIGKTWLSVKVLEQVQSAFDDVIWRSLRPISSAQKPLSFDDLLDDLLGHLSPQSALSSTTSTHDKILEFIGCLQQSPCLIVFDNIETILRQSNLSPSRENLEREWQAEHAAYHELFRLIGQGRHQSCLILTSREEPNSIQQWPGENRRVQRLHLKGLKTSEIQQIFETKGQFQGSSVEWNQLVNYYDGNPLILEIVATTVQRLFSGNINEFLKLDALLFNDICELLHQQFSHLSDLEIIVVGTLVKHDNLCSLSQLRSQIPSSISVAMMLDALKSLESRSLLEKTSSSTSFLSLPSRYVKDYVKEHFLFA